MPRREYELASYLARVAAQLAGETAHDDESAYRALLETADSQVVSCPEAGSDPP
jgi:hypothetical protein